MYAKAISYLLITEKITTVELLQFLKEQKLLSLLPQVLSELYERKSEKERGETLHVETPFALSEGSITSIRALVGAEADAPVTVKEDKELLSGFRATYLSSAYDTSGRAIINELIK